MVRSCMWAQVGVCVVLNDPAAITAASSACKHGVSNAPIEWPRRRQLRSKNIHTRLTSWHYSPNTYPHIPFFGTTKTTVCSAVCIRNADHVHVSCCVDYVECARIQLTCRSYLRHKMRLSTPHLGWKHTIIASNLEATDTHTTFAIVTI